MSATDFKKQLAKCPDQRAVERLLQNWHCLQATVPEYQSLREAVIAKVDEVGN
jgi:hypothetical protein